MSWLDRRSLTVYLVGVAALLPGLPGCGTSSTEDAAGNADRVFVSQAGSSTVLAIDAASGEPLARIDVGMLPHELVVSPDQRTLYVSLVGSQAIAEVDVAQLLRFLGDDRGLDRQLFGIRALDPALRDAEHRVANREIVDP